MDINSQENKVYTLDELKRLSSNWNLKGDKILLEILENINKDILGKTTTIHENLDSLSSNLTKAAVSLLNVNNKFISLGNTQFIENKVQEDDMVIINRNEENGLVADKSFEKNKEIGKSEETATILNAVNLSLDELEGLCEKIQISSDTDSASADSDDNDTDLNVVLRPQNIYINKPLPYIIGSYKWQKKWHIGLQECSSDESDIEDDNLTKTDDKLDYSSSDETVETLYPKPTNEILSKKNQMSLPIPNYNSVDHQSSLTSTSTNNSTDAADSEVAKINSIQEQTKNVNKYPGSIDNKIHNEPAPQTLVKASDFAAELAKKLSANVDDITPVAKTPVEIKKQKPRLTTLHNTHLPSGLGNVFLDEPPPLEVHGNKDKPHDDFIPDNDQNDDVSAGLFGDEDSSSLFSKSYDNMFKPKTSTYDQLFGDVPEIENKPITNVKKSKQTKKKITSLFDDDNSDDNSDLFNTKLSINNNEQKQVKTEKNVKNTSLFDDSDNSDSDHLFVSSKSKLDVKSKPITQQTPTKNSNTKPKNKGLFDDDSDDDLFSNVGISKVHDIKPAKSDKKPLPEIVSKQQIQYEHNIVAKKDPIETIDHKQNEENISKVPDQIENTLNQNSPKELIENKSSVSTKVSNDYDLKDKQPSPTSINVSSGLFDDLPPPLDDDGKDKESRRLFDDEDDDDLFGNNVSFGKNTFVNNDLFSKTDTNINIFSDEPPEYNDQPDQHNSLDYPNITSIDNVEQSYESSKDEQDNVIAKDSAKQDSVFSDLKNDLFSNTTSKIVEERNLFTDSDDHFFSTVKNVVKEKKNETVEDIPNSKDLKPDVKKEKLHEESEKIETQTKRQPQIGKIQSNVNINVKALMPTAIPKSIKQIRNVSEENSAQSLPVIEDELLKPPNTQTNEPQSLDSMLCNDVLKDRAKIKVKRRPSSRKARLEAVRKSAADIYNFPEVTEPNADDKCIFSLPNSPEKLIQKNTIEIEEKEVHDIKITKSMDTLNKGNLFSDDSIEEPETKTKKIRDIKEINVSRSKNVQGLFGDSDSDSELFKPKPAKPELASTALKKDVKIKNIRDSLFDDSDDDIFVPVNKNSSAKNIFSNKSESAKKSLFGDSEDESDLFEPQKEQKTIPSKITSDKTSKNTVSKQTTKTYDDPLSNFLNE